MFRCGYEHASIPSYPIFIHCRGPIGLNKDARLIHVACFSDDDGDGWGPRGHGGAAMLAHDGTKCSQTLGLLCKR